MGPPFRLYRGGLWFLRYPGTINFASYLTREEARRARRAYLKQQQMRTTAALAGNLLPAMGHPLRSA